MTLVLLSVWSGLLIDKLVLYLEASGLPAYLLADNHEVVAIFEEECGRVPRALELGLREWLERLDLEAFEVDQNDAGRLDSTVFREWLICLVLDPLYVVLRTRCLHLVIKNRCSNKIDCVLAVALELRLDVSVLEINFVVGA